MAYTDIEAVEHDNSQFNDYELYYELWSELLDLETAAECEELEDTVGLPDDGKSQSIIGLMKLKATLVLFADLAIEGCDDKAPASGEAAADPLDRCTDEVEGVATNGWRL